jgi:adenine deaminase
MIAEHVTANVIGIIENQAPTRHLKLDVPVHNREVRIDLDKDLAKVELVERHKTTGKIHVGLVAAYDFIPVVEP